jgi:excisionase family DNA binding protein
MEQSQGGVKLLLKIPEAVEATGYSRSFLYERIAAGDIKVMRVGRTVRIPWEELRAWVDRQKAAITS